MTLWIKCLTATAEPITEHEAEKVAVASTAIATFNSNVSGLDIPEIKAEITAQQASGTPTPSNPLPITGWNGANVTRTGKNLLNPATLEQGAIRDNGETASSSTRIRTDFIKCNSLTNYTVSVENGFKIVKAHYYNSSKEGNGTFDLGGSTTLQFTTLSNSSYIKLVFARSNDTNITPSDITNLQLELGSTATSYEPYNGITVTIPFGDTYYGGELDVTNGVLRVTHGITDLGDLNNWTYVSSGNRWTNSAIRDTIKKPASDSSTIDCKCNQLNYMSLTALRASANDSLIAVGDSGILSVRYTTATAETINSLLSGVMLVYELATPIEIQLTPHQIAQLLGENNVFADCGNVAVKYYNIIQ